MASKKEIHKNVVPYVNTVREMLDELKKPVNEQDQKYITKLHMKLNALEAEGFDTEDFNEIGCRKCGQGSNWKLFTDGNCNFKAIHRCGHVTNFRIVDKPDVAFVPLKMVI